MDEQMPSSAGMPEEKKVKRAKVDPVLVEVIRRHETLEKMSRRSFLIGIASIGAASLAAVSAAVAVLTKPDPKFFLSDDQGRIVPVQALNRPFDDQARLMQWVANAVTDAFSFDFSNYKARIASVRKYFTNEGHQKFVEALQTSGLIDAVTTNRYIMSTLIRDVPLVTREGEMNGRYIYVIRVPVIVSFFYGNNKSVSNWDIDVLVIRVPVSENIFGVLIHQIVAKRSS